MNSSKKFFYHNAGFLSNRDLKLLAFKKLGKNVLISKNAIIVGANNISLNDNVRIDAFTFLLCPKGFIKIGKFTHISTHVLISGHCGFELGKFSGLASGVKIYSTSEDFLGEGICNLNLSTKKINFNKFTKKIEKQVKIGDHTNIGANSVILPGSVIGKNSSISACSIVKGKLKGGYIYMDSPLKPILKKSTKNIFFEKKLQKKI